MDANKRSSAFSLANIPPRNLPENTHTATAYFPHLNTQAYISEEKNIFSKKTRQTFGGFKKTAYLCIAIKKKAPWLN